MNLSNLKKFYFTEKDGKETLIKNRFILSVAIVVSVLTLVVNIFSTGNENSTLKITSQKIEGGGVGNSNSSVSKSQSSKIEFLLEKNDGIDSSGKPKKVHYSYKRKDIQYKANQVLVRKSPTSLGAGMPIGSNLIGKLLTSIDTRETGQLYKIILPYGSKSKNGFEIPKETILFGKARYAGKGSKVFMEISRALLPNGEEKEFLAQVLSSDNFSPGIDGNFHGKSVERVSATLGLTMVSAMGDTLTEKEALGQGHIVSAKPSAKNAFYQGVAKVSELEAARHASELSGDQEYVTIPAGKELIINLLKTFGG